MTLRSLPGKRPALSDPVVFDVRLPPGAGPGPAVDRPALREAGRVSSPAFRIGVAVPSATWIPGRTRRPVRGVGGLWIGDASRYPVFSARDRRRIAFGPESTHRPGGIDDAWYKSADTILSSRRRTPSTPVALRRGEHRGTLDPRRPPCHPKGRSEAEGAAQRLDTVAERRSTGRGML